MVRPMLAMHKQDSFNLSHQHSMEDKTENPPTSRDIANANAPGTGGGSPNAIDVARSFGLKSSRD